MDLHLVLLVVVAAAVAYLMTLAGVEKRAIEWKRASRRCPSCGRAGRDCSCLAQ
jgi:hypothetical protein